MKPWLLLLMSFSTLLTASVSSGDWLHDHVMSIPLMRSQPQNYIKITEGCPKEKAAADTLIEDLNLYKNFVASNQGQLAKNQLKKISTYLNPEDESECSQFLNRVYLAKSIELLLDDSLVEYWKYYTVEYPGSNGPRPTKQYIQEISRNHNLPSNETEMTTSNDVIYFLSLFILDRVHVDFLTTHKRNAMYEETENPLWVQLSQSKKKKSQSTFLGVPRHEALGGYRCGDQTIYIDTSLPPFDLGALWIHEMDHLFRDLLGPVDSWKKNAVEAVRTDELLASVMTSFSQWNLRRTVLPSLMKFGKRFLEAFVKPPSELVDQNQYFADYDLLFLNRNGPLATLYSPDGVLKGNMIRYNIFYMLGAFFLTGDWSFNAEDQVSKQWVYHAMSYSKDVKTSVLVNSADSIVSKNYFKNPEKLPKYDPHSNTSDQSPLSKIANDISLNRNNLDLTDIVFSYTVLQPLNAKLGHESDSCHEFHKALDRGDLEDYRHSGDADPAKGKDGTRPLETIPLGKDGTRPGKDGTRPCLDMHDEL